MAYRIVDKQVVYPGKRIRLEIHHLEDEQGRRLQKELCIHPGAVAILPFLDERTIVLIRNRRHAVGQILLELPAGTLEKGENPMNAAGRELLEETGYLASRLVPLNSFFTSPGILSEKLYAFAAYDLQKETTDLDEGEEIEVVPVAFEEAIDMIRTGEIADGKTIAILLTYERFHIRQKGLEA